MSIAFERQDNELILTLTPERIDTYQIREVLNNGDEWRISRTFTVRKEHFRREDPGQNEIQFCVGAVYDEYTLIDRKAGEKSVLGILPKCPNRFQGERCD